MMFFWVGGYAICIKALDLILMVNVRVGLLDNGVT